MTGRPFDAVLVVAFGRPEGMGDVRLFLANVLRGRRVAPERVEEVAKHYEHSGGVSPLLPPSPAPVEGLKHTWLPAGWTCRSTSACGTGIRYLPDTLKTMAQDGVKRAIGFVCAARRCYSSCTAVRENVVSARRATVEAGLSDVSVTSVGDWHDHDRFIEVNARHARASEWLKEHAWKLIPLTRADAHRNPTNALPINDFPQQRCASTCPRK